MLMLTSRSSRRRLSTVSLIVGLSMLSACTMIPKYERPILPVAGEYLDATTPSNAPLAADMTWQQVYPDPKLQHLITLALDNNRDLRIALLNIETARAQYRIQRANAVPNIAASGSQTRTQSASNASISNVATVSLGVSAFELDLFGRVRSLNQQALETFLATEEAQRSTHITLLAEVVSNYYTLAADKALLELAQSTFDTQQETLQLMQRQLDIGVENLLTVSQQQTVVEGARADVANYTNQVNMDKTALDLLVGQTVGNEWLPPSILAMQVPQVDLPAGLPSDLLTRRPDIRSAEHTLLAANANIGAARAAFFPKIALTASTGTSSTDLAGLFMGGSAIWSFIPSVTLPIFNLGSNRASLKQANVARDIQIATYEKTIQTAFKEVSDALGQSTALRTQVNAYDNSQKAAQQSLTLAQARFKYGIDTHLTVLDAQRTLYSAQKTFISTRLSQLNNQATLYKVLGGGWLSAAN